MRIIQNVAIQLLLASVQAQVDPENDYSTLRSDADAVFGSVVQKTEPDASDEGVSDQIESLALKHLQYEKKAEETADILPVYIPKKRHI